MGLSFKRGVRVLLVLLMLLACALIAGWWSMHRSLATLEGTVSLRGLSAPATIQRDRLGVVTIDAANEIDAVRALGYVHAQERFFEMDLMRRTAAGELAGLFGAIAVDADKAHRVHRIRERVIHDLDDIAGDRRAQLEAYVAGVNTGLGDLAVRPWPYLLLRTRSRAWQIADTPLVGFAMYFDLQDSANKRELALWKIRGVVPPALFALLARDGSSWDAPLVGAARGDAVLPDAATLDLRRLPMPDSSVVAARIPDAREIGSNNFAVSGAVTRDGRAIVADDMHLGLRVPNIWFRARLRYADRNAPGGRVDVSGFTLPGLPLVVVGSNRHVAWGFTNSYADVADWALVAGCRDKSPCRQVVRHRERIEVAHSAPVEFDVEEAPWGPVMAHDPRGNALALRWVAQQPEALNLGLARLASAASVNDAQAKLATARLPAQNLVIADADGRIAWRILGPLPQRGAGCDGETIDAASACSTWPIRNSPLELRQPANGRLWTANNRTLEGAQLAQVGDGGYALGARARQIRDDLFAKRRVDERDLLAIQLDDRAVFLQRWWTQLQLEAERAGTPALRELAGAARTWQGHASADSVSYRIVRAWRLAVHARLLDGLTAPAQAALGDEFAMPDVPQFESVAWPLVVQRPPNLLPRRFHDWNALFEDAASEVRDELAHDGRLQARTWGERNTARICHPLSMALPAFAKRLLCMPADPLVGDSNMPRVVAPDFGASERMVVSPGHESEGFIHMPGGQSGNPLSPYWGAGHEDWVQGRATPFLPGKAEHTLRLVPAR